jgi:DNA-binding NarL/FixJ family response regulator
VKDSIAVLIVDDQPLIRSALRHLVEFEPDLRVVGECGDGRSAVQMAIEVRPDVVLMDVRMPGTDGVAATGEITGNPVLAGSRVLVLTTFEDDATVLAAMKAGASGFIGKDAEPATIARAIRTIHDGESLFSPAATRALLAMGSPTGDGRGRPPQLEVLTDREREILRHVAAGAGNDEIAALLHLSPATVKTHVGRIMSKLDAHERAQLVIVAYESGLVSAGVQPFPEH